MLGILNHIFLSCLYGSEPQIEGFNATTLPKGPNQLLAIILLAEKQVGKAIEETRECVKTVLEEHDVLDMEQFINDPRKNSIATNEVEISKIFSWYRWDFDDKASSIILCDRAPI